jgi:hypothetical protein
LALVSGFFVSWRLKPVPEEIHNGKGRGMTMKDIPRNSEETNWKRELSADGNIGVYQFQKRVHLLKRK